MKRVEGHSISEKASWVRAFEAVEKSGNERASWLSDLKRSAMTKFLELSVPTRRLEEWRYTDVSDLVSTPFGFERDEAALPKLDPESLAPFVFGEWRWPRLVFANGRYRPELSSLAGLDPGVQAESLAQALRTQGEKIRPLLARAAAADRNIFTALNTALFQDGVFLRVPPGLRVKEPIHLVFAGCDLAFPRVLVSLGAQSEAALIESYVSPSALGGDGVYFTDAVTEIFLEEGALLDHYKIEKEGAGAFHLGTTSVHGKRESRYFSFSLDLGARLARNDLAVLLAEENAQCFLSGLYLGSADQHLDNTTFVDHAKPGGTSRQLYKGILEGSSTGVFYGKVLVRKDAQKTDARQTNKTLLVSQNTKMDTRPQLEIFADDVKCTHGAAVGQLEEEPLFYLRSRGLDPETARRVLIYGFAHEVIGAVKIEAVRQDLDKHFLARMKGSAEGPETSRAGDGLGREA